MGTKILWRPHPQIRAPDDNDDDDDDDNGDSSARIDPARGRGGGGGGGRDRVVVVDGGGGILEFRRAARLHDSTERRHHHRRHRRRGLIELMDGSLVVGQEVALTAMLLAVHGEIVRREGEAEGGGGGGGGGGGMIDDWEYLVGRRRSASIAAALVYSALLTIIYFNRRSSSSHYYSSSSADVDDDARRRRPSSGSGRRAAVRLSDGVLLAVLLRLLAGVLRSLTASYSADTVHALATCGMAIHLLACDYGYANGRRGRGGGGVGGAEAHSSRDDGDDDYDDAATNSSSSGAAVADVVRHHPRPPFLGGTVSLNAAFFSTVLLASRINSNATSYAFVSSVVTLFAFYPSSRHNIAINYPNAIRGSPCSIVTLSLSTAAWLLLSSSVERCLFAIVQSTVLVVSPVLMWRLQMRKRTISGPWDVAHKVERESPLYDGIDKSLLPSTRFR
ncbi:hypothetical protein ACHAW5_010219 [Stephanodiscus triporus]|uniref:GPI mannosyltransferase 2 n=1 Tax=Stephanodiscus triporus TaxID=2934178 RepID=A0ABD3NNS3_9STRA